MSANLVNANGTIRIQFPCTGCGKNLIAALDDVGGAFKCPECGTRFTMSPVACRYHASCSGTYGKCGGLIEKLSPGELEKAEAEAWEGADVGGAGPTDSFHDDMSDIRGSITTYRCARCGRDYSASYGTSHHFGSGAARCQIVTCSSCVRLPSAAELPAPDTV